MPSGDGARVLAPPTAGAELAVIAGGGDLPRIVLEAAVAAGWRPVVVTIGDGVGRAFAPFETVPCRWNRVGDAMAGFRRRGVRHVVLCGTISVRPDYRSLVPSLRTLALLPAILRLMRGGDDSLIRAASRVLLRYGFTTLAVQDLAPDLLMPPGEMTGRSLGDVERLALDRAREAAVALGRLDIGQAAVASQDRVIALEGIEGTREMLARVAELRRRGRIGRRETCVLFKSVKPQQDLRFDLPSIGAATIAEASAAGLAGIGLSAGRALVIGLDDVVAEARRAGLFLIGAPAGSEP